MIHSIILASQSPRRRELLTQIGLDFLVNPSQGEEELIGDTPEAVVRGLALQKAEEVAERTGAKLHHALVIGADTIVVYEGKILGKPKDETDAARMLSMLQGRVHSVYTGVALLLPEETIVFAEETKVSMYPVTEEEIRWYISTGEPADKAGAYGIQGFGARFIEKIQGDYNNVVGLPVGRIYQELKQRGVV